MRVVFERFTFDSETRELLDNARRVHVSPKAFDLLQTLLERRPGVVTKSELQDRLWSGTFVSDASLSVIVAEVRQALEDDPREPRFVRTVHRVGYAFCGPAVEVAHRRSRHADGSREQPFCRYWLAWHDRILPLAEGENLVGRDPRCTAWIDASGVSRRHARILIGAGRALLEDLDSSNGTFVGGARIDSPHELSDGDVIELGSATVSFRLWSDERPTKTERIAGRTRDGA
jgi:DNA-binding winged helix-turn-helix (wHTH) protein